MTFTDAVILLLGLLALATLLALGGYLIWKVWLREEYQDTVAPLEESTPVFRVKNIATNAPKFLVPPPPTASPSNLVPVMKKTVKVNAQAPCRVTGKPRTLCRHCQENEANGDDL